MSISAQRMPVEARSPRMGALARLPLFFGLDGKRVVIAGDSAAAAWKAELLSSTRARVDVYAISPCDELLALAEDPPGGPVTITARGWRATDLAGSALAIGAFDSDAEAARFAAAARDAGVPVNVIDKPAFCDFSFGAIVNRSPLVVGISTDGGAPVLAQAVRAKIEALLPQGFSRWAAAATRWRATVKSSGLPFAGRRRFWQQFVSRALSYLHREPSQDDLDSLIADVRSLGNAVDAGSVALVGAGPGDPELLTLRAVRTLQSADVILFDNLVAPELLEFARREARKILVGKTGHGPSCRQSDINALMIKLAKAGRRVVRLKGGDSLIFSRAADEIEACRTAGIAVEIVPGITAAQGAAASLGIPLTDRNKASRLQLVTGHARSGGLPADIDWNALADPSTTTAVYMPVKTLAGFVDKSLQYGLDPLTPAVAITRATRPDEKRVAAPIGDLPDLLPDEMANGPTLVLIGQVFSAAMSGRTRHFAANLSDAV